MMSSSGRSCCLLIRVEVAEKTGYRNIFEGFNHFEMALTAVESLVKLIKVLRVGSFARRIKTERILKGSTNSGGTWM